MTGDPLQDLLREADATASEPPTGPADLTSAVLRLARRRQRVRRVVGAGSATAALLIGLGLAVSNWDALVGSSPGGPVVTMSDTQEQEQRLRREIADLRARADAAEALAQRMITLGRRRADLAALERKLRAPDPLESARQQLDRTPAIMVRSAVRLQHEYGLVASAAEAYRRTMNLFPDSPWAQVARRRLLEIDDDQSKEMGNEHANPTMRSERRACGPRFPARLGGREQHRGVRA
ncbi:MAG: hypothetical protein GY778_30220 [bacterium]|nr:hypothetical protein [bacterium]